MQDIARKGRGLLLSKPRPQKDIGGDLLLRLFESEWFSSSLCLQVSEALECVHTRAHTEACARTHPLSRARPLTVPCLLVLAKTACVCV